jgi:hypothetical protein
MAGLIWFRRIRCSCWQRSTQRWLQILLLIGSDLFVCLWPENIVVPRLPAVSVMAPTVGCRGYSAVTVLRPPHASAAAASATAASATAASATAASATAASAAFSRLHKAGNALRRLVTPGTTFEEEPTHAADSGPGFGSRSVPCESIQLCPFKSSVHGESECRHDPAYSLISIGLYWRVN